MTGVQTCALPIFLTNKYLNSIPPDSRAASHRGNGAIEEDVLTTTNIAKARSLNAIAETRSQSLAQMALSWVLKDKRISSVLIGASKPEQVIDSVGALKNGGFTDDELQAIENILNKIDN